jgi:hypothetical protein
MSGFGQQIINDGFEPTIDIKPSIKFNEARRIKKANDAAAASSTSAAAASSISADPAAAVITDINASFAAPAPAEVYFDSRTYPQTTIDISPAVEIISAFDKYFKNRERFVGGDKNPRYPIIISDSKFQSNNDKIDAGHWVDSPENQQFIISAQESHGEKEFQISYVDYSLSFSNGFHEFSEIKIDSFYRLIQYSVIWHKCWKSILTACNEFTNIEEQYIEFPSPVSRTTKPQFLKSSQDRYNKKLKEKNEQIIELAFVPSHSRFTNGSETKPFLITNANYNEIKQKVLFYGVSMHDAEQALTTIYDELFKDFDKMYHITADFYCHQSDCGELHERLDTIIHKPSMSLDIQKRTKYKQRLIKDGSTYFPTFYNLFNAVSLYRAREKINNVKYYQNRSDNRADIVIPFVYTDANGILYKEFIRKMLSNDPDKFVFESISVTEYNEKKFRKEHGLFKMPPNFEEIKYKSDVSYHAKYGLPLTMFIGSKPKIDGGSKTKRRRKQKQRKQKSKRRRNI